MLGAENLENWIRKSPELSSIPKRIGLISAGNLPLVGFHDLLCVLVTGHTALVKLSTKDQLLLPFLVGELTKQFPEFTDRIHFVEQFRQEIDNQRFDAVIATGSNNSSRYFNYYFGKYPHIIRKNRNSIAILSGDETPDQLKALGDDIFMYFGLGCRNVSKIYLPKGYQPESLYQHWTAWDWVMENDKYKNNFDYNRTLLLMNRVGHFTNDVMLMVPDTSLLSRIASLHYEFYDDPSDLRAQINLQKNQLQCIIGISELWSAAIPFGHSQQPGLDDYADGVNTLDFLSNLT